MSKATEATVNREALLKVANLVKPALAAQAYIPSLTHICFDGKLAIAYNDISAILVDSPMDLEMCIPGDLLVKALGSLKAEEVLLQESDNGNVLLSAGRSKLKLPTLPMGDFPFDMPAVGKTQVPLSAQIIKGIERCMFAVGNDPTHPAQMGITLEAGKKGAILYATDNFTVSRFQTASKIELPAGVPVILPKFFCEQVLSLAKAYPDEALRLDLCAGALVVHIGDKAILFTKQLVDLEPMDFDTILRKYNIDSEAKDAIVDIPNEFDASFDRALLVLSNEPDKLTKITITAGKLKMISTSPQGESVDTFSYKDPEAPSEPFFVDPVLTARASKVCAKVAMLDKVMVFSNEDFSFVHMIAHCSAA